MCVRERVNETHQHIDNAKEVKARVNKQVGQKLMRLNKGMEKL